MGWNYSLHYEPWVARELRRAGIGAGSRVVDVGAGDGSLAVRIARSGALVTAVDAHAPLASAIAEAARVAGVDVAVRTQDLFTAIDGEPFDAVTCVATLHHVDLEAGLARLRSLVAPGAVLVIVGLAIDVTVAERLRSLLARVPAAARRRIAGYHVHGGVRADPTRTSTEVRRAVNALLVGARWRTRLYWRYSVVWTAPDGPRSDTSTAAS